VPFAYFLQIVLSALVYRDGSKLRKRQRLDFARRAVVMCFVGVVMELVFAVPAVWFILEAWPDVNGEARLLLLGVAGLRILVVVLFLTAGVKTILVLKRPGVRQLFTC
jgi:hypothetical protein